MCCVVILLFLISQNRVAVLACSDAPGVYHLTYEDAAVADLTRVSCVDDYLHGRINKLLATHNGHCYALDDICRILDATVNAFLSALSDAVHVVILEPVDV